MGGRAGAVFCQETRRCPAGAVRHGADLKCRMSKAPAPVRSSPATAHDEHDDGADAAPARSGKRRLALALAIIALGLAVVGMLAIAITNLMP